jgi:nicotinate phosphoribosyltransferase
MEINGAPIAKRGKKSGSKSLLRCNHCLSSQVVPYPGGESPCKCGGKTSDILTTLIMDGKVLTPGERPIDIRERVLKQVALISKEGIC